VRLHEEGGDDVGQLPGAAALSNTTSL